MSYIPIGYFRDFLGLLERNRARVEVLTYKDLPWRDDWDYRNNYPQEAATWDRSLKLGQRDPEKIYLILQHDVDSHPQRTMEMLRLEEDAGVRSNVMIFNRLVDRRRLRDTGELRYLPYIEDYSYLRSLERKGFVVGYHCNAYEQAAFDREKCDAIVLEDLAELRRHFAVEFMSAHGGTVDPSGLSNRSLEIPEAAGRSVRWVHNGHWVQVAKTFSDGGMSGGKRPPESFDLRAFMRQLRPGRRYRILIHPQNYAAQVKPHPLLKSTWYSEVLDAYSQEPRRDVWKGFRWHWKCTAKIWTRRLGIG